MSTATAARFVAFAFGEPTPASCHSYRGRGHNGGMWFAHACKQLFKLLLLLRMQGLDLSYMPIIGKAIMVN